MTFNQKNVSIISLRYIRPILSPQYIRCPKLRSLQQNTGGGNEITIQSIISKNNDSASNIQNVCTFIQYETEQSYDRALKKTLYK